MDSRQAPYRAYLIRLWPTRRKGVRDCRVLLEEVGTLDRREFPDLDGLFRYLRLQSAGTDAGQPAGPESL